MGNIPIRQNINEDAIWLMTDKCSNLGLLIKYEMDALPSPTLRWQPDYSQYDDDDDDDIFINSDSTSYEYYRRIAMKRIYNVKHLNCKPLDKYWIFSIFHEDTIKNELVPESLRISFLNNICKLSHDENIKYDIYDIENEIYLNKEIYDMLISQNNFISSSYVHNLIDPNKYILNEHKLWIPTIFDCNSDDNIIIKSQIPNLDYIKYKCLYFDISSIFTIIIQPMFEDLLGHKLGIEKIIICLNKIILNKIGNKYIESEHFEGMGEDIICIAKYYPQSSNFEKLKGGELRLSSEHLEFDDNNKYLIGYNGMEQILNIQQGSCVVFSNELCNQLQEIQYIQYDDDDDDDDDDQYEITRTVLSFYLISPFKWNNIKGANHNKLNVNLMFNWIYIIKYWLRIIPIHYNINNKINKQIEIYLFGTKFNQNVYKKRHEIRKMKNKFAKEIRNRKKTALQSFANNYNNTNNT